MGGFWIVHGCWGRIQYLCRVVQHEVSRRILRDSAFLDAGAESSIRARSSNMHFPRVLRDSGRCGKMQNVGCRMQDTGKRRLQQNPRFLQNAESGSITVSISPPVAPLFTRGQGLWLWLGIGVILFPWCCCEVGDGHTLLPALGEADWINR